MDDLLSVYTVPQEVKIRSKWLRLPELVIETLLFLGFIVYNYFYLLGFTLQVETSTHLWQKAESVCPVKFIRYDGATVDGDCIPPHVQPEDYDYCAQFGPNMGQANVSAGILRCVDSLPLTLMRHQVEASLFFSTSLRVLGHNHSRVLEYDENVNSVDEVYVAASERLGMVKVAASVADMSGASFDFQGTPVVLHFAGEDLPRPFMRGCGVGWRGKVLSPKHSPGIAMSNQTCGGDADHDSGHLCCGTEDGLYMSLAVLLKAANVSMTDVAGKGTIRQFGGIIDVHLDFSNMKNFWSWPVGFKPMFVFRAARARFTEHGQIPEEFYETYINDEAVVMRGLSFKFHMTGRIGVFQFIHAVKQLTLAAVILGLTKKVVSIVLVFFYKRVAGLDHVAQLHDISRYEVTRADHEIMELLAGSSANRKSVARDDLFHKSIQRRVTGEVPDAAPGLGAD